MFIAVQSTRSAQSAIRKPQLKRNYQEFASTKNNPPIYQNLFTHQPQDAKPASKPYPSSFPTLTTQESQPQEQEQSSPYERREVIKPQQWKMIQQKLQECMNDDLEESIHQKGRKNYSSRYRQREDVENIWVGEAVEIPREIKREYEVCAGTLANGNKVNFIQGFLSQIGFMFYGVGRKVFFYDIEKVSAESQCLIIIETQQKIRNALYNIQILEMKQPYFVVPKKVLALFHFHEVELYDYKVVKRDINSQRMLQIKSLAIRYRLEVPEPRKLVPDSQGLLYYTDYKGVLKWIEPDHSGTEQIALKLALTTKQMVKSVVSFWDKAKSNISFSVTSFNRVVGNIKKSLFPRQAFRSSIVSDLNRNILITYYSQRLSTGAYSHELKVYSADSKSLAYSLSESDFLDRSSQHDAIVSFQVLDSRFHQGYNMVLLLNSGKRVFLDLNGQHFNKAMTYPTNPTSKIKYFGEQSQKQYTVESHLLEDTLFATLLLSNTDFCLSLIRNELGDCDQVVYKLNVRKLVEEREYYLFSRNPQVLGSEKQSLLHQKSPECAIENMCSKVQGVFFRPKEIIHASDVFVRRVVVLREVDILFTIVQTIDNVPQILRGIRLFLGGFRSQDLISLVCQILFDSEGIYWVSRELETKVKKKLQIRVLGFEQQYGLEDVALASMRPEKKNEIIQNLEALLVDLSLEHQRNQSHGFINGFLAYLSRLMRPLWKTDINQLSHSTCKTVITLLKNSREFLLKLHQQLRTHNQDSLVSSVSSWLELVKQLFFVVSAIPTLPSKPLHAAIVTDPEQFHEYLFRGLKTSNWSSVEKFSTLAPWYCDRDLLQNFKFWLDFSGRPSVEARIQCCMKRPSIPQYLLREISKTKGMTEVELHFSGRTVSVQQIKQFYASLSFSEILERIKEGEDTLIDKQILLEKGAQKLEEEYKNDQDKLNEGRAQIALIRAQLHLQQLLKEFYLQKHDNRTLSDHMHSIIKKPPTTTETNRSEIVLILEHNLFDSSTLAQLISATKEPLLEVAFANYFQPEQLVPKLNCLISSTVEKAVSIRELPTFFKEQLTFLLTKAKIDIDKEVLIKLYIEAISEIPETMATLKKEGILEEQLFFPLVCLAQLWGQPEQIYKWGLKKLNSLGKTSDLFIYLCACMTHFIRKYLWEKREEFSAVLVQCPQEEPVFERMKALLL